MDRTEFMNIVYDELQSDSDNNRANRIIDAADEYAAIPIDSLVQKIVKEANEWWMAHGQAVFNRSTENVGRRAERKSDLINKQDAIEVVDAVWAATGDKNVAKVWDQIKDLPFVQPEIIRCPDCKWWDFMPINTGLPDWHRCRRFEKMYTRYEDFCSRGERGETV